MALQLQLDGEAWSAVLADLSQALGKEGAPSRLCLIGSAARDRATENLVYLDVLET
jgi:hypothetical protein